MPEIPEYYKHLASQKKEAPPPRPSREQPARPTPTGPAPMGAAYRAQTFDLRLAEGWDDQTVYTLLGPVEDDVQHNVTVVVGSDINEEMTLIEFAQTHIQTVEQQLKGCRVLLKERVALASGRPAVRAIYVWYPTEEVRLYQEQLYILDTPRSYILTASFSKKTRKTLGPAVERMMLSFEPHDPARHQPPPARSDGAYAYRR
ncbi:MAG: DcrB-related protein [Bacteroidota bacterium]